MPRRLRATLAASLVGVSCLLAPANGPAFGQTTAVDSMRRAFEELDYDRAEEIGQRLLADPTKRSVEELAATHELLGILAFYQNRRELARQHFESLLSLDPAHELDPRYASPKVRDYFRILKQTVTTQPPSPQARIHYIRVPDLRPGAAWRSLLFPGWGHIYRGEKKLGRAIAATTVGLVGTTVAFYVAERSARSDYLAAREPAEIAVRYDRYNRYYRLRRQTTIALAVVWIGAYLDASLRPVRPIQISLSSPSYTGLALRMQLNW